MKTWIITSRNISEIVRVEDQWEAWDTLKGRPASDFGLIVSAEADESDDPIPVQTETLMRRWGRVSEADQFHAKAREMGRV